MGKFKQLVLTGAGVAAIAAAVGPLIGGFITTYATSLEHTSHLVQNKLNTFRTERERDDPRRKPREAFW